MLNTAFSYFITTYTEFFALATLFTIFKLILCPGLKAFSNNTFYANDFTNSYQLVVLFNF